MSFSGKKTNGDGIVLPVKIRIKEPVPIFKISAGLLQGKGIQLFSIFTREIFTSVDLTDNLS